MEPFLICPLSFLTLFYFYYFFNYLGRGCCVHDCSVHRGPMRPSDSLELELLRKKKNPDVGVENQTQVPARALLVLNLWAFSPALFCFSEILMINSSVVQSFLLVWFHTLKPLSLFLHVLWILCSILFFWLVSIFFFLGFCYVITWFRCV